MLKIQYATSDSDGDGIDDVIHLHNGWNEFDNSQTYSTVDSTEYQYLNSIIWLDINEENLPHNCSDNYHDIRKGLNFCACNVYYETHPNHVHSHYNTYNENSHWKECVCNDVFDREFHDLYYIFIYDNTHYEDCANCNYRGIVSHNYEDFTIVSGGHIGVCDCGKESGVIEHSRSYCQTANNFRHNIYCECGYVIGQGTHTWVLQGLYNVCTECGARARVGDDFILLKFEKREEDE